MPRSNTPQAPSFDEFGTRTQFSNSPDAPLEQASMVQQIIFESVWANLFAFSLVVSLIIGIATVYAILRYRQIRKAESDFYASQPLSSTARKVFGIEDAAAGSASDSRWQGVLAHVNAETENDWRQAVLEADSMLDDAITSRGYTGEGLGEKLKQVQRSDINSIDDAWEAHKLRNKIAHEGSNFQLTQREARRAIGQFERVFKELGYITA